MSLEVTLVTVHRQQLLQILKIFTKKSLPVGVQQEHWLPQISPPNTHPFKCQIQLQIIKLPPNKRRLEKGCGCFMWFLLNEGDYFTAKPSTVGLAAKILTLHIKAPTRGQSAKMKVRLVLRENLFLWLEVFFSQVFTEISQLRPVFVFSSVHRSYHYEFSDTCKLKKFPPIQQHLDTKGGE